MNATGLIRSIAVPTNAHWVAVGQSSGYLTVIDLRTGQALANWKGHEGEVLNIQFKLYSFSFIYIFLL